MAGVRAGKYKHRVCFDSPATSQGPSGEELITWVEFGELFASIEPLTGRETLISDQPIGTFDTKICIRWSPNNDQITDKWRARRGLVIYNIKSIAHINLAQREIEIMCNSGKNNG